MYNLLPSFPLLPHTQRLDVRVDEEQVHKILAQAAPGIRNGNVSIMSSG
jgi:hypothetical protein